MIKRTKKISMCFLMIVFFLSLLSIQAFAENTSETSAANAETLANEIYAELDDDAAKLLSEFGLSQFDMDSVITLSPRKIIDALLDILKGAWRTPFYAALTLCAVAVLGAFASAFYAAESKIQTAFDFCAVLLVTYLMAQSVTDLLGTAFSAVKLCSDFMLTYIPGFTGIIAMSGKPLTSAAYSSVMVAVSNAYAQIGVQYFQPILLAYLFLGVFSSLQSRYSFQPLMQCAKKAIYIVFGFAATVFSGLLTVKGLLASGGDSVTVKGVKMLVGSAVPIVGGALSEGVTSVLASASLIKNTVGVFGIFGIVCMVLPSFTALLLWYFAFTFGAAVAQALEQDRVASILQSMAGVLSIANAYLLFTAYVFMASTGIILQFRGN